jgi:2-keto-4-pentenoate hydratase/2-oxohepta-3-ene-1,7-dioic acid hydratase in catechol pathway
MKIALIVSKASSGRAGIGVAAGDARLLDIGVATEVAEQRGRAFPPFTTVKALVEGGTEERQRLEDVVEWAREVPVEEAIDAGLLRSEADVTFLPPIPDPEKFICVGKNYRAHLDELVRADLIREIPDEPAGFMKLNSVLVGHGAHVARPKGIVQFDYEPELAFVIGRGGQGVSRDRALEHVFGITLFNDLTAREVQRREVRVGTRFWTAKNMPGFGPIGPYVVTLDEVTDPQALEIECRVNGVQRSRFTTADMIYGLDRIIEHYSEYVPMVPGDLFATGSAAGVAAGHENAAELFLRPGDVVDVVIDGLMSLRTHIIAPNGA